MMQREANCLHIQIPMTLANATRLLEGGRDFFVGGQRIVDLADVKEADSSGLAVLLEWQRIARATGGEFSLTHVPECLRTLANLYDLDDVLIQGRIAP
jgi:phospholipid transport system transporter-binding protein